MLPFSISSIIYLIYSCGESYSFIFSSKFLTNVLFFFSSLVKSDNFFILTKPAFVLNLDESRYFASSSTDNLCKKSLTAMRVSLVLRSGLGMNYIYNVWILLY